MFVTKEMLFDTQVKAILEKLAASMEEATERGTVDELIGLDEFAWEHLEKLGRAAYEVIGEYYGDLDAAYDKV